MVIKLKNYNYFLIIFILFISRNCWSQPSEKNRYPNQIYFQDSTHVFWTWYPNPFSPPTISVNDSLRIVRSSHYSWYCDISDTCTFAIIGNEDSILYSAKVTSKYKPNFGCFLSTALPKYLPYKLPENYVKVDSSAYYNLSLIVNGKKQSTRKDGIYLNKDWYYWIYRGNNGQN